MVDITHARRSSVEEERRLPFASGSAEEDAVIDVGEEDAGHHLLRRLSALDMDAGSASDTRRAASSPLRTGQTRQIRPPQYGSHLAGTDATSRVEALRAAAQRERDAHVAMIAAQRDTIRAGDQVIQALRDHVGQLRSQLETTLALNSTLLQQRRDLLISAVQASHESSSVIQDTQRSGGGLLTAGSDTATDSSWLRTLTERERLFLPQLQRFFEDRPANQAGVTTPTSVRSVGAHPPSASPSAAIPFANPSGTLSWRPVREPSHDRTDDNSDSLNRPDQPYQSDRRGQDRATASESSDFHSRVQRYLSTGTARRVLAELSDLPADSYGRSPSPLTSSESPYSRPSLLARRRASLTDRLGLRTASEAATSSGQGSIALPAADNNSATTSNMQFTGSPPARLRSHLEMSDSAGRNFQDSLFSAVPATTLFQRRAHNHNTGPVNLVQDVNAAGDESKWEEDESAGAGADAHTGPRHSRNHSLGHRPHRQGLFQGRHDALFFDQVAQSELRLGIVDRDGVRLPRSSLICEKAPSAAGIEAGR